MIDLIEYALCWIAASAIFPGWVYWVNPRQSARDSTSLTIIRTTTAKQAASQ